MKRSIALLAVAALLGTAALLTPSTSDAWWGGPGGFSFSTPWGGFNMNSWGGWGGWGGPWGGWGGGPWGGGYGGWGYGGYGGYGGWW